MRRIGVDVGGTDVVHEFAATAMQPLRQPDLERLGQTYADLEAQAAQQLEEDGFSDAQAIISRFADCSYAGQGYEVRFEVPAGPLDTSWQDASAEAFHRAHEREYGQRFDANIDIVNVRVTAVGLVPPLEWPAIQTADGPAQPKFERDVVFEVAGQPNALPTPFYDRAELRTTHTITGPAVIEQYDSTTVVPPGLTAQIDAHGKHRHRPPWRSTGERSCGDPPWGISGGHDGLKRSDPQEPRSSGRGELAFQVHQLPSSRRRRDRNNGPELGRLW